MAEACLKVLRHHKVAVFMPVGLACCGIPALSSGDAEGMIKQMKVNLEVLGKGDFDYLLSPCASCTSTIKELWPRYAGRLGSLEQKQAEKLAEKTMDINAFLVDVAQGGSSRLPPATPCPSPITIPVTSRNRWA